MPFGKRQREQNNKKQRNKVRGGKKIPETDALAADLGRLLNIWVGLKWQTSLVC